MASRSTRPATSARGATAIRTEDAPPDHDDELEVAELELIGRLLDATNATFVAQLPSGRHAVYKPIAGERPLDDFPHGTLANRERAAYLLSQRTGWHIVPRTVLRDGPLGRGAVQEWIDVDESVDIVRLLTDADPRLRRVAIFDAIVNNADRKGSHLLPTGDGHVYGVDHGVTFAVEPKLRSILWAWRGEPLTESELGVVADIGDCLTPGAPLAEALGEVLSAAEVDATRRRVDALLSRRRFPLPDPGRPALPWPPF